MASRSLGTLTLDIIAQIGGYTQGLDKAEREAKKRADAIEKAFDGAFSAITAGFAAMAAAGAAALAVVNQQIESIANFQGLAEKIGDTAAAVASLQTASTVSGVALETVATASVRLTASLSKAGEESKNAAKAVEAIGISFETFKNLSPVEQIDAIARGLAEFADGSEKSAIAVALFGRAGAELIPFFNDLANGSERNVRLTEEQIAAADQYSKQVARLKDEFDRFLQQQSAGLLPVLRDVVGILSELARNQAVVEAVTLAVNVAVKGFVVVLQTLLVVGSTVASTLQGIGREIGAVAAQAASLARLDFKGFSAIGDAVKEDGRVARSELDKFQAQVMAIGKTTAAVIGQETTRPRIKLPQFGNGGGGGGSKGATDDPTKKILDNQIKDLERYIASERELMSTRQKFLDLYNAQGLISVKDYYDQQAAIRQDAFQKQNAAYDAEIEALKKYQATVGKESERVEAQGKINDVIEKQAKLQRDNGNAALEAGIKQVEAQKAVQSAYDEVNAKILELQGNLGAAAAIRFDASNERLTNIFTAEKNQAGLDALKNLRDYTIAQADLNKLQQQFSLIQGDLQIAEERITIARERGTIGEIESLKQSGEARKAAVAQLREQLAVYESINAAARTPEQEQAIQRLKLQLEQLSATIDPLADKFNTLLSDAAGNAFADFITGTKTAKEAFQDFAKTVINEIAKMAAQDLAKSIFGGGSGGSNGVGGFLSSLFGGAANDDVLGAFIGSRGFAFGGYTGPGAANDPAGIVHKGEYVLTAEQTKAIGVGNLDRGNFGGTNVFNINVPDGVSRQTGSQIAAEAQRKLAQGARNR